MSHLSDLKKSGHWPSLLAAFLHFDISFTVWVILGALAPFVTADVAMSGPNLHITPLASVTSGRYQLAITGPRTSAHEGAAVYHLAVRLTGAPLASAAVESFTLDNAQPATFVRLNQRSHLIRIALAGETLAAPHAQTVSLSSAAQLQTQQRSVQTIVTGLSAGTVGFLIALPLLAAGFFRIILGMLADRFGSKRVGTASMALTLLPLLVGWQWATNYGVLLCVAVFLGLAGASFAVSLPLASRWYPPHLQGLALGIAGAGNSGTVIATLCAPLLAGALGWHAVFGLLMIPVTLVLCTFLLLARDAPGTPRLNPLDSYRTLLVKRDTYVFCLLYFVTFGGFVGFSSFLNTFFVDQFHIAKATVGVVTVPFVVAGSLLRPVGGALADRFGGTRVLSSIYGVVMGAALLVGLFLTTQALVSGLLLVMMGCLGMGNGSVFQIIPQRFRHEMGAITGLVGAVGGVGGFYLNVALGSLKDISGSYAVGFWAFTLAALFAFLVLRATAPSWIWLGMGQRSSSGHGDRERVGRSAYRVGEPG